jgi:hypothetical protein
MNIAGLRAPPWRLGEGKSRLGGSREKQANPEMIVRRRKTIGT